MSDLRLVAALCLALVCATLSYTTYSALVPTFIAEWRINNTESGLISDAFFAGYVAAVPVLVSLTDRIDPRRILLASLALSALAPVGFALVVDGFWSATPPRCQRRVPAVPRRRGAPGEFAQAPRESDPNPTVGRRGRPW